MLVKTTIHTKMEDSFEIDCRVRDTDGFRGTIRYIGPVAAAKNKTETWLGVEWDKQDRGKHDGSCVDEQGNLHRYFKCALGAGSFVKMNKVMGGRSLGDALRERYVGMDAPSFTRIDDPVLPGSFVTTSKGNTKPIEFHGEHKVRLYQQLSKVDAVAVRNDTVANIEPNIGASIGHVIEVDLQDNLIYKWSELATLTACVPGLQTLLLHGNRMQDVTPQIAASLPPLCYSNLRTLALNACSINSWASMHRLAQFLPAIEQLYLSGNCLEDLPKLPTASTASDDQINQNIVSIFTEVETSHAGVSNAVEQAALVAAREAASAWTALRVLDISGCKINDWSQILFFAFFPSLEEILLDSNPFERIAPCPISGFSALSRLSCSDTLLKEWADIDALATYAQMANLRLSHIPLFSGRGASEVRPYVIARIPQLDFFNGSTCTLLMSCNPGFAIFRFALHVYCFLFHVLQIL